MSWQSNAHLSEVCFRDVNQLVDDGDAVVLEDRDITLHLDGGEPVLHGLALQWIGGTAVAVWLGWTLGSTA